MNIVLYFLISKPARRPCKPVVYYVIHKPCMSIVKHIRLTIEFICIITVVTFIPYSEAVCCGRLRNWPFGMLWTFSAKN